MNVIIRPESANIPNLLDTLKKQTICVINALQAHNINLPDDSIKIWVKQFAAEKIYLKIEFDLVKGEELQYDLDPEGMFKEIHFKAFRPGPNGKIIRYDLNKEHANPMLARIDDVIQSEIIHSQTD